MLEAPVGGQAGAHGVRPPAPIDAAQPLIASGRLDEAEAFVQAHRAHGGDSAAACTLLAIIDVLRRRPATACEWAERATELAPGDAQAHFALGRARKLAGHVPQAIAAYRRAIELDPDHAQAHVSLGIALKQSGDLDGAARCYRRAIEIDPHLAVAHANLANLSVRPDDAALASAARAVALDPGNVELQRTHGLLLLRARRLEEAVAALNLALGLQPSSVETCLWLGEALKALGKLQHAMVLYEQWLQMNPPAAEVMRALANAQTRLGRVDAALEWATKAAALDPQPLALLELASTFQQGRRQEEALAAGRRAIAESGGRADHYPVPLMIASYVLDEAQPLFEFHAEFGAALAAERPLPAPRRAPRPLEPGRRLRLGYVSGDFLEHSVTFFFEPLLQHHDRSRFEVYCYHNRAFGDAATERLKALSAHWVECEGMSDEELYRRVQDDGIDILVDLSGHTAHSRLFLFALAPAPLQVGYLGYPTVTGVRTMDHRITDAVIDPGDLPALSSDRPLHLPRSMFCYRPPEAPPVGPPPVQRHGVITFGSFNNVAKVTDATLALWAQALRAVPGSRLLLKSSAMAEQGNRYSIGARLSALGVASERLSFAARTDERGEHLARYGEIDIALDTYPYNGATTTCEALWMGVPVVTRRGATHASRMGASILEAAGCARWVAHDDAAWVNAVLTLAADAEGLAAWRAGARERLAGTALRDEAGHARAFENLLLRAWSDASSRSG